MNGKAIRRVILWVFLLASPALAGEVSTTDAAAMTHRMMMLVLQLGLIIFAARLGAMLFERLRLPRVLGELAAGMLIGPYLLGGIALPGFREGLFPMASAHFPISPELYGICALASVVLLFMVGLETDIRLFMRYSVAGSAVGVGGVILPFVLGDLMAILFSRVVLEIPATFFSPGCLFLGIVSTATSVGISARVLSEQRRLESPEGITILAGAVIDDVLGIVLLAIGMGVISASTGSGSIDWIQIGIIAIKAVGIWLAATLIGLLASRRISLWLKLFGDRSAIAVMSLGLALILGGLFEEAGLAMIIGAYVMGLSLSKTDINQVIREKMHPIHALLVPVFFTVMGMLVDLRLLASREVLLFGVLYTAVVNSGKLAGCAIPALFCNFNLRGALRIGVGMLPRGEVTLIIAGIGMAAGVVSPEMFGVVIFMLLVSSLLAPPWIVRLFRTGGSGLRRERLESRNEDIVFSFPSPETTDLLVRKLLAEFESEGFYVHTLNRRSRIYQLRKSDTVIGFRNTGSDIIFDCSRADVPIINTAMVEVLADLEKTIAELRKPVDRVAIGRKVQERVSGASRRGDLATYMSPRLLCAQLEGDDKEAVIAELLALLDRSGVVRDLDAARDAVWTREKSMSTGMQFGIAIPHGRTDAVSRLVCAVGLKPDGVEFGTIDGKPARIIVLTLSPSTAAAPHMQFMSMVSQALDEEGREELLACETSEEMFAVLTSAGNAD